MNRWCRWLPWLLLVGCTSPATPPRAEFAWLLPQPQAVRTGTGTLVLSAPLVVAGTDPEATSAATALVGFLDAWGLAATSGSLDRAQVRLHLEMATTPTPEAYHLVIGPEGIELTAADRAGLLRAGATLAQLLLLSPDPTHPALPHGELMDAPRHAWRGWMLDVARHFFQASLLRDRYLPLLALYKFDRLHLHLSDDQGWRLEIPGWPELTRRGATTAVGGAPGGYYTAATYASLVYAADRLGIAIVPEFDVPGHVHAALVAYPELGGLTERPEPYTGVNVGFSSLCLDAERDLERALAFATDVWRTVATWTPTPWLHFGGDEAYATASERYAAFVTALQARIAALGGVPVAWEEAVAADAVTVAGLYQLWKGELDPTQLGPGDRVILSPARYLYLDMRYDLADRFGTVWAGLIDTARVYDWEPETFLTGLEPEQLAGLEAPVWTEFVTNATELDLALLPRLLAVAELAWSGHASSWPELTARIRRHRQLLERHDYRVYPDPSLAASP